MVLDALEVGALLFHHRPETEIKATMQAFACKYGLLGIITALPTTARFIEVNSVVLPKNDYIRDLTMPVEDYVNLFFPFRKPDLQSSEDENLFSTEGLIRSGAVPDL